MFLQVMEAGEDEDPPDESPNESPDEIIPEELPDDEPMYPDFLEHMENLPVEEQIRKRSYYASEQDRYFDGGGTESFQENAEYTPPTNVARYDEQPDFDYYERNEEFDEEDIRYQQCQCERCAQSTMCKRRSRFEIDEEEDAQLYDEEDVQLNHEEDVNVEREQPMVTEQIGISQFSNLPKELAEHYMKMLADLENNASNQQTLVTAKEKCENAPMNALIWSNIETETLDENCLKTLCETLMEKLRDMKRLDVDVLKRIPYTIFFSFPNCTVVLKLMPAEKEKSDEQVIQEAVIAKKCQIYLSKLLKMSHRKPKHVEKTFQILVQELIDAKLECEVFIEKCKSLLSDRLDQKVTDFLKKSVPPLRQSLASNELTIDGITPPPHGVLTSPISKRSISKEKQEALIRNCKKYFENLVRMQRKSVKESTLNLIKAVMDGKMKLKKFGKILKKIFDTDLKPVEMDFLRISVPLLRKSFAKKGLCDGVREPGDTVTISLKNDTSTPQVQPAPNSTFMNCVLQAMFISPVTQNTGEVIAPCTI